jgi:hypothetical protein
MTSPSLGFADRPKLLFFQFAYDPNLPTFLLTHVQEHVSCLQHFFDVTVVAKDCDFLEVCDAVQPDIVLFETGVNHSTCRRLNIANLTAHPDIPRVGLHNADAFCNARAGFLSDVDHWHLEAVFAIATTAAEHTPEMADILFVWPNSINPELYRDYGAWKSIPVLLTGNTNPLYPWREKVFRRLAGRYPALHCPHPGYGESVGIQFLSGETYARTINASLTVPTCGTVARELVRKHLEIPGSNSCLVTERSPALEAAGFVDMINCVFADEHDVTDKLEHLFRQREELAVITQAGHLLVHSQHTWMQRSQIRQWYDLRQTLPAGRRIVQSSPFEPLTVTPSGTSSRHIAGDGQHLQLLRQGDDCLRAGDYTAAERLYLQCRTFIHWMPEPKLRAAICRLALGDPITAHRWIDELVTFVLGDYGAVDPDPVEWGYLILVLVCRGRLSEAVRKAEAFPHLRHPELDRARWVVNLLTRGSSARMPRDVESARRTIHRLPQPSEGWVTRIGAILSACGQDSAALSVRSASASAGTTETLLQSNTSQTEGLHPNNDRADALGHRLRRTFKRRVWWSAKRARLRHAAWSTLHRMGRRWEHFLPYRVSDTGKDALSSKIEKMVTDADIRSCAALVTGRSGLSTSAFIEGAVANPRVQKVFCVGASTRQLRRRDKNRIYWKTADHGLDRAFKDIAEDHGVFQFDAFFVPAAALKGSIFGESDWVGLLSKSRLVFVEGLDEISGHLLNEYLLRTPNFHLIATDAATGGGVSIFERGETNIVRQDQGFGL